MMRHRGRYVSKWWWFLDTWVLNPWFMAWPLFSVVSGFWRRTGPLLEEFVAAVLVQLMIIAVAFPAFEWIAAKASQAKQRILR